MHDERSTTITWSRYATRLTTIITCTANVCCELFDVKRNENVSWQCIVLNVVSYVIVVVCMLMMCMYVRVRLLAYEYLNVIEIGIDVLFC